MNHGFPRQPARLMRSLWPSPRRLRRAIRTSNRLAGEWLDQMQLLSPPLGESPPPTGPLSEINGFGDNPGRLRLLALAPPGLRRGAPLLMLLHGCGQDAARFAQASGFAALAARLGAVLLLPEQQAENNRNRCFTWFSPEITAREVASLRQMTEHARWRFAADPARVFVAGLSAGGAMAAALLAACPELFAAGAVVAGLPVGAASNTASALASMEHAPALTRAQWLARLPRRGEGRWPRLSVWHGTEDRVVDPANADALVAQWTGLLGLSEAPSEEARPAPHLRRRVWRAGPRAAVEQWSVAGLGHAFPVAEGLPTDPFVLPAGIAAAEAIARFWGLDGA
jgi:poly(hydroxyalkanoate) depolymerase family esterase